MLCNLDELAENLKTLISEMSEIHNKIVNPIEAKKNNAAHSFLIKLPKIILLVKVCPYLEIKDINNLSTSCVGMRRIIYSPIGWKILTYFHTPYPIQIKYETRG
jgi:hypothetical protein